MKKQRIPIIFTSPKASISWMRIWKSLPVAPWIRGAESFRNGDFLNATSHYKLGINLHPNHPALGCATLDYGYCLYRLNKIKEAIEALETAIELPRIPKECFLVLAKLYRNIGNDLAASEVLSKAVEQYPQHAMLNAQFALVLCATNGFSHAMSHVKYRLSSLRKEQPLDSKEQLILDTALAAYEFRFGDSMLADRILARVLATGEAPSEAILMKAERYFEQQRGSAARELLDRVVQMEPRDPRPLALLSRLYLCFDEEEGAPWALVLAKRACELSQWQNPACLQLIAECYEALDDKNAFELFQERAKSIGSTRQLHLAKVKSLEIHIERLRNLKPSNQSST